ncbi:MAG: DUF937 domain-containing protein [Acidobacteria bacterium]|nr:MAG: DUF937 domain-containing protein [Acidobacteriota bacterium]REK01737.1 MAG: DUF937 domain-containing protein [Acidobacteriota bacterium]REK14693.1 MAG: DUF937 domain-containing protein [Acidobacteriota bacterium]REK45408.1 MAG: DUF937 domain-containing protein [Acidobacteriota bacterium]
MNSLEDLLGAVQGSSVREQIGQNLRADSSAVNSAIEIALPAIMGGLAQNSQTVSGAAGIDQALEKDHDGSLLESLSDYLQGGVPSPANANRQTDGSGILGHILGNASGPIAQEISKRTGLSAGQSANLLITLAPIVMAYLGKQKKQNDLDTGSLSDLIQKRAQQTQRGGNPILDLATSALDRDRDGSALDDLASMAADYFMK